MADPADPSSTSDAIERWTHAVIDRHKGAMTTTEFLKAVRALSARYVERRANLGKRSPIDSAGKRAAFAGFFAPLHLITVTAVIRAIGSALGPSDHILDLGCGTGVASAAWAFATNTSPALSGIDTDPWALTEAAWNWRSLGLRGRARRGQMADAFSQSVRADEKPLRRGIVLGWSANELPANERADLLRALLGASCRHATIFVLEPLARSAVPWWSEWAGPIVDAGGRADAWKLDVRLPARLAELDHAAGFRRDTLGVRTLMLPGPRQRHL